MLETSNALLRWRTSVCGASRVIRFVSASSGDWRGMRNLAIGRGVSVLHVPQRNRDGVVVCPCFRCFDLSLLLDEIASRVPVSHRGAGAAHPVEGVDHQRPPDQDERDEAPGVQRLAEPHHALDEQHAGRDVLEQPHGREP
jgi:hypothetical protein